MNVSSIMSNRTLQITLLADEWKSSKGGLSTINRMLAIQFAKHPNVSVTFFVPKCTEEDKKAANSHNITIAEAQELPGFEPIDWLCFPPRDLVIDIIIGHGVKLGKQAQVIRNSHHCTWVQVVHTAPEELAMFKTYHGAISKGDSKQWTEVKLCQIADLIIAVGPKLHEFYSANLSSCEKNVFNLTPGIFTELSTLKLSTQGAKKFRVLVFGRGDSEDFELKGFDIAAKAVAELNDKSYHLFFVGAPNGNEKQVAEKLLDQGLNRSQLTVKGYLENRDDLARLLSTVNLALMPSRIEGFGLTALEALSAGLPFLASQNSGFGEALQEIPFGSSWIVDSEDPVQWAEAIKSVREKGTEEVLKNIQELRRRYAEKYSWEKQRNDFVEMIRGVTKTEEKPVDGNSEQPLKSPSQEDQQVKLKEQRINRNTSLDIHEATANTTSSNNSPGARPKEVMFPSSAVVTRGEETSLGRFNSISQRGNGNFFSHSQNAQQSNSGEQSEEDNSFRRFHCKEQRETANLLSHLNIAEPRGEESSFKRFHCTEQREAANFFSRSNSAEPRREERQFHRFYSFDQRRGVCSNSDRQRGMGKSLAILGCDVSDKSIRAVRQVFHDIGPKLNLSTNPPIGNYPPIIVKQYLITNHLKFCVLVVDAKAIKDAYGKLSRRKDEYEDLLKTAANLVDETVVVLICDSSFKSDDDEAIVGQTIERTINEKGKGFVAWLKNGRLSIDPDILVQCLTSTSPVLQPSLQDNSFRDLKETIPANTVQPMHPLTASGDHVLLRSPLRYGRISYSSEDLQIWDPQFVVPEHIAQRLSQQFRTTPVTGVIIVLDHNSRLQWSVNAKYVEFSRSRNEGIQLAPNESLVLKTLVRNGHVSFQESDIRYMYGNLKIPQQIIERLKGEHSSTPCGELYVVSDEKGNLRCTVKIGKINQFLNNFANKLIDFTK